MILQSLECSDQETEDRLGHRIFVAFNSYSVDVCLLHFSASPGIMIGEIAISLASLLIIDLCLATNIA